MIANDELRLLIKSRYPVIFFETVDESYSLRQLVAAAQQLEFIIYQWSLTEGLRRHGSEGAYYQTKEPSKMLRTVLDLIKPRDGEEASPGLFVLSDFEKYLKDPLVARLFKDTINRMKNTRVTCVILSATYGLPPDIEADAARFRGGYPAASEIRAIVEDTIAELRRTGRHFEMGFPGEEFSRVVTALQGLSMQQIRSVVNQCVLDDRLFNICDLQAIESYKRKVFDQEGLLEFHVSEDKRDIAGFHNLKRWLAERQNTFAPGVVSVLPVPKGVLLMGVQGCGKSLAVKVIARELNLPVYRLDMGRLYSKYIGETEQNLRKALAIVEKLSPLCLWIDEIEKGFAVSGGDGDGGVSQRILGTFLTWMQERKTMCFIAATANNIYRLPPEFLRKGRFDEIFFVDLPDAGAREQLLQIHLQKRGLAPEQFDLTTLVEMTHDFSGAEIEELVIAALYRATSEQQEISTAHLADKITSTKPLAVLKSEEITALREWAAERTIPA